MFKLKSLSIVTNFTSEILQKLYMSILFPSFPIPVHPFLCLKKHVESTSRNFAPAFWMASYGLLLWGRARQLRPSLVRDPGIPRSDRRATRLPRLDGWYWLNSWIWWLIWFDGSSKIDWLIIGWIIGFDSSQIWWLIWFYNGRSYEKMDGSTNINHPRMENGWVLVDKKYIPKFMVDFIL